MKYASTTIANDREEVVVVLPIDSLSGWNPDNPPPGTYAVPDEVCVGWVRDGDAFIPPPPPSIEQLKRIFTDAVQRRLDEFARTRGYDGILSAATYATSTVPQFQIEGQYAVEARDLTWAKCYQIMNAALAGERDIPTLAELLDELPVLEWPEL